MTSETPQDSSWYDTSTNRISNGGSWGYDGAGNITAVGYMARSFAYDPEERQTQAVVNGVTENYVYDGEGRRVAKSTSSGTTTYIYDADGQLAMEFPSGSAPVGTAYLTADMLGSTRLITDGSGNATECEDYLPFGEQIQSGTDGRSDGCFSAADLAPEKKFTGKERDAESGLDYFGARYFSSAQGRFTSPDWSAVPQPVPYADLTNPQSLNLYNYMRNNPLGGADPDGHCDWNCWSQFGSGVADTTYRPILQTLSHPLDTGLALLTAASHPLDTAVAIKDAVVDTTSAALSGDPNAVGQVVGTVVSTAVTAGAAKVGSALVEGAQASRTAARVAQLLGKAEEARDALAGEVGASKATVTGGYNLKTGQVAARACEGGLCAEDHVNNAVGGADGFTKAVRPGRDVKCRYANVAKPRMEETNFPRMQNLRAINRSRKSNENRSRRSRDDRFRLVWSR